LETAASEGAGDAELQAQLRQRDEAIAALRYQLESAGAAPADDSAQQAWAVAIEHLDRRRRRLQSIRNVLDARAGDLTRAAESIAARARQLEAARRSPEAPASGQNRGSAPSLEVRPAAPGAKIAVNASARTPGLRGFRIDLGALAKRATLVMALF